MNASVLPALYFDFNATSPVLPEAAEAALQAMLSAYGNPSSSHARGREARAVLDTVRQRAREVLGAPQGDLMFVSGATEGIQTAVLSALCAWRHRRAQGQPMGRLLVYGATEHKAVPQSLAHWNQVLGLGLELRALPVDALGRHDLASLRAWLPDTAMLCTMAANNETGVVSDLDGIEQALIDAGSSALWLVDGVQALGKLDLKLAQRRIDYAPFSGHKLHAPKGIGLLYVRTGAPYTPLMAGGGQEGGLRSGTENMPGIAALGAVLQALQRGDTFCSLSTLQAYRAQICACLQACFPGVVFNAPLAHSLPTTLNFSVPGPAGAALTAWLDAADLQVSAGSACSAAQAQPSFVLQAMGCDEGLARAAVRLSLSLCTRAEQVDALCERLRHCAQQLAEAQSAALSGHALAAFSAQHPQACWVDVRSAQEHAACAQLAQWDRPVLSWPLADLMQNRAAPSGLVPDQPWLLLCQSGQRSAQAWQALRQRGQRAVWQLAGGVQAQPLARPVLRDEVEPALVG
ncbi:aminotransferase class V-fold PLP-dependent enzyme [Curvibacter sp. RS43]|uniref:aminotransferase class V-fold PLP-dependent enzyme n=1 Tax=Curvibacter microcysteis TaxID=3026419 RepID=UPI0023608BFF|nr:aminotransferase class V-fold PLP-dependent enzyme [Curvibacter sp. RS43]MDD0810585.1 aminotransferase class V-fold PLP-dependent enzyme [Curvibacter sp. RS43]